MTLIYLFLNLLKTSSIKPTICVCRISYRKIKHLLDSDIVEQLPQASSMKQLIQKPENIHSFTPKYHKLSEAERNWLNQQENN